MDKVYWTCPACGRESHVHTHMDDMTEAECIHCHHVETVVNFCLNGSNVYPEKERFLKTCQSH